MANITISRITNGVQIQDPLSIGSLGLNQGFAVNDSSTLEEILYIRHDGLSPITNLKLFVDNTTELINWADTTANDGILLDLDNDETYEVNINSTIGNTLVTAINLPDLNPATEMIIRIKTRVPSSETSIGNRNFNLNLQYVDGVTESFILLNELTLQNVIHTPCDSNFLALLPEVCKVTRAYEVSEGIKNKNEYGEVIPIHSEPQVIAENVPVRIDFVRQRGEVGYSVDMRGGSVFSTHRIFMCPQVNVLENDIIEVGNNKYQVQLVEKYYDFDNLHHLELFARRIDFT